LDVYTRKLIFLQYCTKRGIWRYGTVFYLSSNDDIVEIFTMWPAYNLQYNFTAMDENIRQEMVQADEERELYRWNGWNRKNEWNGM